VRATLAKALHDPRTKMLLIIAVTTPGVILQVPWVLAALLVCALVCALLWRAPVLRLLRRWRAVLWLLLVVAVLQIVFTRTGAPAVSLRGAVLVTSGGLNAAACVALRYGVILVAGFIMSTATMGEVMRALLRLRLPYRFVFMVVVCAQFIPRFAQLFRDALASMQLRGLSFKQIGLIKKGQVYLSLIFPVIAAALVAAQDLAIAMEIRGFGAYKKRSSLT